MTLSTTSRSLLAVLIVLAVWPNTLEAQRRGRSAQAARTGAWAPIAVGLHGGYDNNSQGPVLGAQIRAPIVPSGTIEIMPSGSVTFLTGLKEYQFNLDAVYMLAGRRGGIYVAGGLAMRSTIYEIELGRETKTGVGVAFGLRAVGESRVGAQLEARKIYVDDFLRPTVLSIGVNVALWGRGG